MKFLKTYKLFENNQEFNVGDYVKIVGDYFDQSHLIFFKSEIGKIEDIKVGTEYPYDIKFFKKVPLGNGSYIFSVNLDELEPPNEIELDYYLKKHLSKEEYKKFLINKKAAKYNIL
jgi:hypothetical protein